MDESLAGKANDYLSAYYSRYAPYHTYNVRHLQRLARWKVPSGVYPYCDSAMTTAEIVRQARLRGKPRPIRGQEGSRRLAGGGGKRGLCSPVATARPPLLPQPIPVPSHSLYHCISPHPPNPRLDDDSVNKSLLQLYKTIGKQKLTGPGGDYWSSQLLNFIHLCLLAVAITHRNSLVSLCQGMLAAESGRAAERQCLVGLRRRDASSLGL